jgi:hypothetical protein
MKKREKKSAVVYETIDLEGDTLLLRSDGTYEWPLTGKTTRSWKQDKDGIFYWKVPGKGWEAMNPDDSCDRFMVDVIRSMLVDQYLLGD